MDERDHKAMNEELKSTEQLANDWANEYYERESESTSVIMEKDEWLNRRYNFLTGYNKCKEDFQKQLKEKEEEIEKRQKITAFQQETIQSLKAQLAKSNEMAERLAGALYAAKDLYQRSGWRNELAEKALNEYQNSKK